MNHPTPNHPRTFLRGVLFALILFIGTGAAGQDGPEDSGDAGSVDAVDSPLIAIKADNVAISDVLKEICHKARWGLVLDADDQLLDRKVTVLLPQRKPASRVLDMILPQNGLSATMEDGILRVFATPVESAPSPAEPAVAPQKVADDTATPDSDSRDLRIDNLSDFRNLKKHLKDKIHGHREWEKKKDDNDDGAERVEMGSPVVIDADETLKEAVSIGGDVTVFGKVTREVVSVGGNVIIKKGASVAREAVAVGGDVLIESGARVDGEAVAVGGKVIVEDGAEVKGDRVSINIPMPAIGGVAGVLGMGAMFWVLAAILRSIVILAVALIIVWIAPERVTIARDYLVKKTGMSLFSGLLILLGTIPAIIFLAITIIGLPLIPFLILLLIGVIIFGLSALLLWLGNWIPLFKNKKSPTGAIILGFLVFLLINMIPVIGGIFLLLASLAAAGATFLSRFGKKSRAL